MPSKRAPTPEVGEAYWCLLEGASTCTLFVVAYIGQATVGVRKWLPYREDWDRNHIQVYPKTNIKFLEEARPDHYPKE